MPLSADPHCGENSTPPGKGLPQAPHLRLPVTVYFYDTDAGGVVHNVAYLRMIEMARSELAAHLGWPLADMLPRRGRSDHPDSSESTSWACPVVARTEIDYIKPARLGDQLVIDARLASVQRVRFVVAFEMLRQPDDEVICRCRQTMVPVDLSTGRPQPLRKDWRDQWGESQA